MVSFPINLNEVFELYLINPFSIGIENYPISGQKREILFPEIVKLLNLGIGEYNWGVKRLDEDYTFTYNVQQKCVYIWADLNSSTEQTRWFQTLLNDWPDLEITGVNEYIWYLDWGVWGIDIKIKFKAKTPESLSTFRSFAEFLMDNILQNKDQINLYKCWDQICTILRDAMGKYYPPNAINIKSKVPAKRMPLYGIYIAGCKSNHGSLIIQEPTLKQMIEKFTDKPFDEKSNYTNYPAVITIGEGFDGDIVIYEEEQQDKEDLEKNASFAREKILWFIRIHYFYNAKFYALTDGLSNVLKEHVSFKKSLTKDEMKAIHQQNLEIQIFVHEALPDNIGDTTFDDRIYRGLWETQRSEKITSNLLDLNSYMKDHFAEALSIKTNELQDRVNNILFVLNVITFTTAIATIITTYDVGNNLFLPDWRLMYMVMGTILFAILSIGYIRGKKKN